MKKIILLGITTLMLAACGSMQEPKSEIDYSNTSETQQVLTNLGNAIETSAFGLLDGAKVDANFKFETSLGENQQIHQNSNFDLSVAWSDLSTQLKDIDASVKLSNFDIDGKMSLNDDKGNVVVNETLKVDNFGVNVYLDNTNLYVDASNKQLNTFVDQIANIAYYFVSPMPIKPSGSDEQILTPTPLQTKESFVSLIKKEIDLLLGTKRKVYIPNLFDANQTLGIDLKPGFGATIFNGISLDEFTSSGFLKIFKNDHKTKVVFTLNKEIISNLDFIALTESANEHLSDFSFVASATVGKNNTIDNIDLNASLDFNIDGKLIKGALQTGLSFDYEGKPVLPNDLSSYAKFNASALIDDEFSKRDE